jgi:RimJ/RimL family protein N-acetyltransferase
MAAAAIALDDLSHADWRSGLPTLERDRVILRELRRSDAPALLRIARSPEVTRYTWPAPGSVEEFTRFIEWTWAERAAGKYVGFGIVPRGQSAAAGLFELRQMQPRFFRAELGFFLDRRLWGTGLFNEASRLMLDFAARVLKIHRVEARVAVDNERSNAALRKMGAAHEGVLVAAFVRGDECVDQNLWALLPSRNDGLPRALRHS